MTSAALASIESLLARVQRQGREQLYEHEVYELLSLAGPITPPRHFLLAPDASPDARLLDGFGGEQVVLKLVSPQIVHKTEAAALAFVSRNPRAVREALEKLRAAHADKPLAGVLLVEYVAPAARGFGQELFVGIRATREFGPVIAAGLGGTDTEFLAENMRPGVSVVRAAAAKTSAAEFLELFRQTAGYAALAGRLRGRRRVASDDELCRCFEAFISLGREFCTADGRELHLAELEVNPFVFRDGHAVPLDGRGRLGSVAAAPAPRPIDKVRNLLEPRSLAVLGVSSKVYNFGRLIANNVRDCGFPLENLYIVKPGEREIDGIRCVESLAAIPDPLDLVVVALPAAQLPEVIDELAARGGVAAAILIPGGVGEREGSEQLEARTRAALRRARQRPDGGPVFVGPNSMGIQSRPGRYDTFFIPSRKLDSRMHAPARPVAIVSQSGAFIITRLSNLETLDPALALSIGNQFDLTVSDYVKIIGRRDDIDVIGVYAEGFADLDGLAFVEAVEQAVGAGKVVVFYKAGRTAAGRSAAAGHTAALAGDYDVCQAAVSQAGALVAETFKEFEQLLELATALHRKPIRGTRVAAVSNAGYETVGMADAVRGAHHEVTLPPLREVTRAELSASLARHGLETLVNARNPLDLTPMASDEAYEDCVRVLLGAAEIDAAVVSVVPLSPAMLTTPDEIGKPGSLGERLPRLLRELDKPLVAVIDCGSLYDPLARMIRSGGVPVFRSADEAMGSLGRYLCHRLRGQARASSAAPAAGKEAQAAAGTGAGGS